MFKVFSIFLIFASSIAYSDTMTMSRSISLENISDQKICQTYTRVIATLIRSERRFKMTAEKSKHRIYLNCTDETVTLEWNLWTIKNNYNILILSKEHPLNEDQPEIGARDLLKDALRSIPWDGEIVEFRVGTEDSTSLSLAKTSTGSQTNPQIQLCHIVNLAHVRSKKDNITRVPWGKGLIVNVTDHEATIQVLNSIKPMPAHDIALVFSHTNQKALSEKNQKIAAACREKFNLPHPHLSEGTNIVLTSQENTSRSSTSKSFTDVTSISQSVGLGILKPHFSSHIKLADMPLLSARNKVSLGDYFSVDAHFHKSFYEPEFPEGININSQYTFGKGLLFGRLPLGQHEILLGAGLLIEKISLPIFNEEDMIYADKPSSNAPIVALQYTYDTGHVIIDTELMGSLSSEKSYILFGLDTNLYLTETWYIGLRYEHLTATYKDLDESFSGNSISLLTGFKLSSR